MDEHTQRRRARLRARTTAEIKETALRLLAEGGPDAISLRAIAREMGMSGSAVYGYFATRDALLRELINDVYASVLDRVEAARDAVPADDTGGRIAAWGLALREWALANPTGFRLIYGDVAATRRRPSAPASGSPNWWPPPGRTSGTVRPSTRTSGRTSRPPRLRWSRRHCPAWTRVCSAWPCGCGGGCTG